MERFVAEMTPVRFMAGVGFAMRYQSRNAIEGLLTDLADVGALS